MIGLWILVYTITITSGPALDTQGQPRKYPYTDISFEPPAEWEACYNIKKYGVAASRKKMLEAQGNKGVTVTARCRQIGKE